MKVLIYESCHAFGSFLRHYYSGQAAAGMTWDKLWKLILNKQLLCLIATSKNGSHSQISFLSHTSSHFIWPSNDFPAMLWRRWDLLWTLQVSCAALMVAVGLCSRCLHSLLNVWKGDICQMFMWLTHDKRDTIEQQTDTTKSPEVIYATNSMQFKQVIDKKNCTGQIAKNQDRKPKGHSESENAGTLRTCKTAWTANKLEGKHGLNTPAGRERTREMGKHWNQQSNRLDQISSS